MDELQLESGRLLHRVPVRYKTWGALNAAGDNVLVVCHALTGNGALAQAKASQHPNHAAHSHQRSVGACRLSIGDFVGQWMLRHGGQRCSVQAELSTQTDF
jgi:homoserine O-acetyltransferase